MDQIILPESSEQCEQLNMHDKDEEPPVEIPPTSQLILFCLVWFGLLLFTLSVNSLPVYKSSSLDPGLFILPSKAFSKSCNTYNNTEEPRAVTFHIDHRGNFLPKNGTFPVLFATSYQVANSDKEYLTDKAQSWSIHPDNCLESWSPIMVLSVKPRFPVWGSC